MKNTIYIDIDSNRKPIVKLSKPPEIPEPKTPEEAEKMIMTDIQCVCEVLCSLIHIADQNGYSNKDLLVKTSIKHLNDLLNV